MFTRELFSNMPEDKRKQLESSVTRLLRFQRCLGVALIIGTTALALISLLFSFWP